MPPAEGVYFVFRLQVVFVSMKKSNVCVTQVNRIFTEPEILD